jgi:hypothetical protein
MGMGVISPPVLCITRANRLRVVTHLIFNDLLSNDAFIGWPFAVNWDFDHARRNGPAANMTLSLCRSGSLLVG